MSEQADSAIALLAEIEIRLVALNALLSSISNEEKRKLALYEHYALGAYGGVIYASGGAKAVYDPMKVDPGERARIYQSQTDNQELRSECRRKRMPERMIWDRFPPHGAAESAEMAERIANWDAAHPPPGGKEVGNSANGSTNAKLSASAAADAFERFVRIEARKQNASPLSPAFRAACRQLYDAIPDFNISL